MGVITITISKPGKKAIRTVDKAPNLATLYADLYSRLEAAAAAVNDGSTHDDFNPDDHPHAPAGSSKGGQFVSHGGGGGEKPTTTKAKAGKPAMHELFSSGHPFTKKELMDIAGVKSEKLFSDYIAMLKNPKYAGKAGALKIKKLPNGSYQVVMPNGQPAPPAPAEAKPREEEKPKEVPKEEPKPEVKKLLSTKGMTPKQMDAAFQKHSVADIQSHFKEKFGLTVLNDVNDKARKKQITDLGNELVQVSRDITDAFHNKELSKMEKLAERKDAILKERRTLLDNRGVLTPRGHNKIDLSETTAAAKQQRKILSHLDAALEHMEEQGFDVKGALAKADVAYVAGSPVKSIGHAWKDQWSNKGYFSLSNSKNLNKAYHDKQQQAARNREHRGEPIWSRSVLADIDEKESVRSTIIHEMAHALGLHKDVGSPEKLSLIMRKLRADGHMPAPELPEGYKFQTGKYDPMHHFIANRISQYATTNIKETDAEIAAMVTSPHYKPGTLPKELEDHVHWLFNKRKS